MLPAWPARVGGQWKAEGCKWEILDKHEGVFIPSSKPADTGAHQTRVTWVARARGRAAAGEADCRGEQRQDLQGASLKRAATPSGANCKNLDSSLGEIIHLFFNFFFF